MEIIVTILIVLAAAFIIYKNIKDSTKGKCSGCSGCCGCSKSCPSRKDDSIEIDKK